MPLFSYNFSSSLRHLIHPVRNNNFLIPFSTLKMFKHRTVFYEPYKEIQRSSSEKLISAQIVGRLISLWDKKNNQQELKILDIGSHDATMLTNCLTQAGLPKDRHLSLLAVDKESDIVDRAKSTLFAFSQNKRNIKYDALMVDAFSSNFSHNTKAMLPKANIILLMNVLYGTKKPVVNSLFHALEESFLEENGVIISAHAEERLDGVIHLINKYAYHSQELGEDGNDQPSLIKNIVRAHGLNMVSMRWPIRLYFRAPSQAEWRILEEPARHHELRNNLDISRLLQILIFLCKETPINMAKRTENDWISLIESVKLAANSNRLNGNVCYLADEIDVAVIPSKHMKADLKFNFLNAVQKELLFISHKSIDTELGFYENWAQQRAQRNLPEKPETLTFSANI